MQCNLDVKKTTTMNDLIVNGNVTFSNPLKNISVLGTSAFSNISVSNLNVNNVSTFKADANFNDRLCFTRSNCNWYVFTQSNLYNINYADLIFQSANNTRVTFTDDFDPGTFNFTGSHRCKVCLDINEKNDIIGKIVVSVGEYNNLDDKSIIDINEAVPVVELATKSKDKRVFGVVAGFEENNVNSRSFKLGNIRFNRNKSPKDAKIIVNAVGEGGIWICNANGNFENGDLITSGEIGGYGVKQDNEILTNYTVGKITCDCDFNLESSIYKCETFYYNEIQYKRAFVGCIYKC
jgi:hypothetical protein